MTEPQTAPRRGRRARALSPEEQAALEARSAMEPADEKQSAPGVRGPVAAPSADSPVPALRKFGRRARIIELTEQPAPGEPDAAQTASAEAASERSAPAQAAPAGSDSSPGGSVAGGSAATITRDHDGVELGELSVTEAPEPRPAPRFDGKVLHRPESSGGRVLPWLVWALIAVALVVLVVLLLTGVLGGDAASAAASAVLTDPSAVLTDPSLDHLVLEETAA